VVTVCGDGGFVMNASAVLTAVEYEIPVVWVVWNNGGFSVIRDQQLGYFGQGRELATMFRARSGKPISADYAAMGRSMGAEGWIVEKPADLAGQLEAAIASHRPTVLDVRVDPDIRPLATGSWDLPPLPPPMPNFGWDQD
jgi:acetolactate synthase-1/2/3 large subunit